MILRRYQHAADAPLPSTGSGDARRAGITLIELVLVLALLSVLASLAAPVVENSFITMRLRRGGDRVLAAWAKARSRAIETGEIQQFTYELDGREYRITEWVDPLLGEGATTTATAATAGLPAAGSASAMSPAGAGQSAAPAGTAAPEAETDSLPEQIHFHAGQAVVSRAGDGERQRAALSAEGGKWSMPVLFFPDGSTSDASLTLATDSNQYQRITLRGLTGVGRASLVLGRTELQRLEQAERSTPR
ncbi:MAG: hypothetical protein CMJ58_28820 [Planctomycetaceae bacterium]|nr:hypothetical protein [Planctomycetaceae bacterium]